MSPWSGSTLTTRPGTPRQAARMPGVRIARIEAWSRYLARAGLPRPTVPAPRRRFQRRRSRPHPGAAAYRGERSGHQIQTSTCHSRNPSSYSPLASQGGRTPEHSGLRGQRGEVGSTGRRQAFRKIHAHYPGTERPARVTLAAYAAPYAGTERRRTGRAGRRGHLNNQPGKRRAARPYTEWRRVWPLARASETQGWLGLVRRCAVSGAWWRQMA